MAEILEMYHSMSGCGLSDLQTVLQVINEHQALDSKVRQKLLYYFRDIRQNLRLIVEVYSIVQNILNRKPSQPITSS